MQDTQSFHAMYRTLEKRMEAQAESDGDIYLPNLTPDVPVDYVFICMEPSIGRWGKTPAIAKSRIANGFRNFIYSLDDFILHYCATRYLCDANERYHVTDVSKGAMPVEHAAVGRVERYIRWHRLLEDELKLILRPEAGVIAVGKSVADHLQRQNFERRFVPILHYSGQAAAWRKAGIVGRELQFEEFRDTVSLRDVLSNADAVMVAADIPAKIRDETLSRLSRSPLSDSRRQLMFIYKTDFERIRKDRRATAGAV